MWEYLTFEWRAVLFISNHKISLCARLRANTSLYMCLFENKHECICAAHLGDPCALRFPHHRSSSTTWKVKNSKTHCNSIHQISPVVPTGRSNKVHKALKFHQKYPVIVGKQMKHCSKPKDGPLKMMVRWFWGEKMKQSYFSGWLSLSLLAFPKIW